MMKNLLLISVREYDTSFMYGYSREESTLNFLKERKI